VNAELVTGPGFETWNVGDCDQASGWWPDATMVVTDATEYAAYQDLWQIPSECITMGLFSWQTFDFSTHDLAVIGHSESSGCTSTLSLTSVEDCAGERQVDANFYWCGPCDATVQGLQVYLLPKAAVPTVIDVATQNELNCP
jgi:hypothetical protein